MSPQDTPTRFFVGDLVRGKNVATGNEHEGRIIGFRAEAFPDVRIVVVRPGHWVLRRDSLELVEKAPHKEPKSPFGRPTAPGDWKLGDLVEYDANGCRFTARITRTDSGRCWMANVEDFEGSHNLEGVYALGTEVNVVEGHSRKIENAEEEPSTDDPTILMHRIEELEKQNSTLATAAGRVPGLEAVNHRLTFDCRTFTDTVIKLQNENARLEKNNADLKEDQEDVLQARASGWRSGYNKAQETFTASLDTVDARADKLLCEARERQYEADVLPTDEYFARMRKALESQILTKVVRELRSTLIDQPAAELEWTYYRHLGGPFYRVRGEVVHIYRHLGGRWKTPLVSTAETVRSHSAFTRLDGDPTKPREPRVWQSSDETEPPVGTKVTNARGSRMERRQNGWHYTPNCPPNCVVTSPPWQYLAFPLTEVGA